MNKILNQKSLFSAVILALFTVGVFASPVSSVEAASKKIKVQCRSTEMSITWFQEIENGTGYSYEIHNAVNISCYGADRPRDWSGAYGIKNGDEQVYKAKKEVVIQKKKDSSGDWDGRSVYVTFKN